MQDVQNPPYKAEVVRKLFHLTNLAIPLIYFFIPKSTALIILIPLTAAFIAVDILRYYHEPTARLFYRFFGLMLRQSERDNSNKRLNGATYVLISATICIIIFPKLFAVTGLVTLTFADGAAALVGRRYGRIRFFNKSLEGSLAFFATACLVALLTPKFEYAYLEYVIGIAGAAVGALAEAGLDFLDDNIVIPASVAATLWIGYSILLPHIDVYMIR
jgi:dolichol kinase